MDKLCENTDLSIKTGLSVEKLCLKVETIPRKQAFRWRNEVATLSGLDRKVVDKVFAELKKTGEIVSPVRCKWTPAE